MRDRGFWLNSVTCNLKKLSLPGFLLAGLFALDSSAVTAQSPENHHWNTVRKIQSSDRHIHAEGLHECEAKGSEFNQTEVQAVMPYLIDSLKGQDLLKRQQSLRTLIVMGRRAAFTISDVQSLEEVLKDDLSSTWIGMGEPAGTLIFALWEKAPDDFIQRWTGYLVEISRKAPEIIPELIERLRHRRSSIRESAAYALGQIGIEPQQIVQALIPLFSDSEYGIRSSAAFAVGLMSQTSPAVLQLLFNMLNDKDNLKVISAINALEYSGSLGKPAIPIILAMAQGKDRHYFITASTTIGRIISKDPTGIPFVLEKLDQGSVETRCLAARSLAQAEHLPARDVIPSLVKALVAENNRVNDWVIPALGNIGTQGRMDSDGYLEALQKEDMAKIEEYEQCYGRNLSAINSIIPALISQLECEKNIRQQTIIYWVYKILYETASAYVVSRGSVSKQNQRVQGFQSELANRMFEEILITTPAIIKLLNEPDSYMQSEALKVFGEILNEVAQLKTKQNVLPYLKDTCLLLKNLGNARVQPHLRIIENLIGSLEPSENKILQKTK
ncbi:MAG: hypothetical protein K1Y36_07200 [Blastocatellia bacterium]|nr:hypothetical protein [Blastocatellia bacterium]